MKNFDYNNKLKDDLIGREDVKLITFPLQYIHGSYEFQKIISLGINEKSRILLIRAGIHGDEVSGPLTLLENINQIIDYAHSSGLKIIIYPLGNPSGFENGRRYNIDNDLGVEGNNDFLRYELKDGSIKGDIGGSNEFKNWHWSSENKFKHHLPIETTLMHELLREDPLNQVVVSLDLHQDYLTPGALPTAYHYVGENPSVYKELIDKIDKIVPVLRNVSISAGFGVAIDNSANIVSAGDEELAMVTDEYGSIIRHDGSFGDLLYRLGVVHSITTETTGVTPIDLAIKVNLIWIYGLIDLVKRSRS